MAKEDHQKMINATLLRDKVESGIKSMRAIAKRDLGNTEHWFFLHTQAEQASEEMDPIHIVHALSVDPRRTATSRAVEVQIAPDKQGYSLAFHEDFRTMFQKTIMVVVKYDLDLTDVEMAEIMYDYIFDNKSPVK